MKEILIVAILSFATFVAGGSVSRPGAKDMEVKNALDDFIMAIINSFKNVIVDGNECLGIPPLDPLLMPGFPLSISTPLLKMRGEVSTIKSEGLRTLEVTGLSCNILTLMVDLVMDMPSFYIGGLYDVDGLAAMIFPIYGKGPFLLDIGNFKISGKGQLGARLNGSLIMRQLDFTMEMQTLDIRFEGLLGGGELGDVLNQIINILGLAVYDGVRAILHDTFMESMLQFVNFSLKDVLLADIIGGIIKPPQPTDPVCGDTYVRSYYNNNIN